MGKQPDRYTVENPAAEYFQAAVGYFLRVGRPEMLSVVGGRSLTPLDRLDRHLRLSTFFCAFSAEAYVNAFLALALDPQTVQELDREPTPRKYVLGIERALGSRPLDPDAAPLQAVIELFKKRDKIVHLRPVRVRIGDTGLTSDPIFGARSLVAVADCVLALRDCLEETDFMGPLETMWDLGDEIDVDLTTIEAERAYFFTGGLIHVVAEAREELEAIGSALLEEPTTTPLASFDLFARSRDLEAVGWG
jgi:hypothetical protein